MKGRMFFVALVGLVTLSGSAQIEPSTYEYIVKESDTLRLDVYRWQADTLQPAVIFSFGGAWEHGDRSEGREFLEDFAAHGYVGIGIDYRLGVRKMKESGSRPERQDFFSMYVNAIEMAVEDLFDATAYVIEHAGEWGIDTARIVLCGGSAGAINSVVGEWNICNRSDLAVSRLPEGFNYAAVIACAGGVWKVGSEMPEWPEKPCPFIIYHGTADPLVPYDSMSIAGIAAMVGPKYYTKQLEEMGVSYLFHTLRGQDHTPWKSYDVASRRGEMLSFLERVFAGEEVFVVTEEVFPNMPERPTFSPFGGGEPGQGGPGDRPAGQRPDGGQGFPRGQGGPEMVQ